MLRSENLTITVPSVVYNEKLQNPYCNKNCKYCVSVMTGFTEKHSIVYMLRNLKKVHTFAKRAGITSVLLTGKGEPTLNITDIEILAYEFNMYALELQTNGILLSQDLELVGNLQIWGFDTIAISIDSDRDFERMIPVIKKINDEGMTARITVNVCDKLQKYSTFKSILAYAKTHGALQVLFRKLSVPTRDNKSEAPAEWIKVHGETGFYEKYDMITQELNKAIQTRGEQIRVLNTGEIVWSVDNVSVVSIDYCIQEESDGNDIRSLIFHEDGHLYTQWNDDATRLF